MQFKVLQKTPASIQWLFFTVFLSVGFAGCASMPPHSADHSPRVEPTKMVIMGGGVVMQQWTQEAVLAYCEKKYWPSSLKEISHLPAAKQPLFNQPTKTSVLVSKENTLLIHFKLGGVLMNNFSHELIIYPPSSISCQTLPLHYEMSMQPQGNAVVYVSKPQKSEPVHHNVKSSS